MAVPIRVLHVDDEPDFADLTAQYLTREDERLEVVTETNASDGLSRLADERIDCIVSDYQMPSMNGLEFLEAVRKEYPDLPFLLFTGKGSEEVASDAITAGATDYLQKGGTEQYELLANRVLNAVEQDRATRRATELDRIRTLHSDINQALIRAESRADLETRVCEIFSESDPYLFAWIGELDPDTDRIEPRASAGIEDDYLDEITVTADDTSTGQGPGGTAIRERRVAVSQNIASDPEFEPWREHALDRGYQSVAAVPLEHEDILYGELVVYAERPHAFDTDEQELLAELGTDIAHAIHALELREVLREERDRRKALFENAPVPVIAGEIHERGDTFRITDVNDAFEDVFGYETTEVVGSDVAEVIVPDKGMDRHEAFREQTTNGEPIVAEVERRTADGTQPFLAQSIPYARDEESVDGWYAWYTNISELRSREQAIEALHRTTNALMEATTSEEIAEITVDAVRDILDMPANGIHLYDENEGGLVPVAWTERTEEIVGEPPTIPLGEGITGTAFETGEPQIYDDISTVPDRYNPDTDVRSQIALPLGDHGVLLIGSPEPDAFDDTEISLTQTLAAHVTTALTRNEREQTLERYHQLIDTIPDPAGILDADGRYEIVNEALAELHGISPAELKDDPSRFIQQLRAEHENDPYQELVDGAREELRGEQTIETFEGEPVTFEYRLRRILDEGEFDGIAIISRDITERKRLREQYELVVQASTDAFWDWDPNTDAITRSDGYLSQFGYDEATVGSDTDWWRDRIHPDDRDRVLTALQQAVTDPEYTYDETYRFRRADGSYGHLRSRGTVVYDHAGDPERMVGAHIDVTDQMKVQHELERQNERLEDFASVVSHDLRNPLRVAEGRLELAQEQYESQHLEEAANAVDRSLALIEDLLTLAREGERVGDLEPVTLADTLEGCWRNVETADATLVTKTDQTIHADSSRLKELLENLLRNAVEHGGDDVTITVGDLDTGFYVADDGPGIPEDEREQVFETGYSTRNEGTGFGLNICKEIAEAHGWDIRVTDGEDGGARFEITNVESTDC
ncbi:MAG: PAS domain S-box protein [Halobacteriales archaeon]|nr:PAS domain S-box protein [Halobacteriales archaeon]